MLCISVIWRTAAEDRVCLPRERERQRREQLMSIDETKQFVPLNIAVLTISDTRSLADDKSGTTLADRLTAAGHKLAAREIVTDDVEAIRGVLKKWIGDAGLEVDI